MKLKMYFLWLTIIYLQSILEYYFNWLDSSFFILEDNRKVRGGRGSLTYNQLSGYSGSYNFFSTTTYFLSKMYEIQSFTPQFCLKPVFLEVFCIINLLTISISNEKNISFRPSRTFRNGLTEVLFKFQNGTSFH